MQTYWYYNENDKNKEIELCYYRSICTVGKQDAKEKKLPFWIKITADSKYKLYINGNFVEIGPSRGNAEIWFYDKIDIAPFLQQGKNVIAIEIRHDSTEHWEGNCGFFRTEKAGLFFETDKKQKRDITFSEWKCKKINNYHIVKENPYFSPLMIYEEMYGQKENQGWKEIGYDDSEWKSAGKRKREELPEILFPERLEKRSIPFMKREKRKFQGIQFPISIPAHTKQVIQLDAGELMTGFLKLTVEGGKNAKLELLQAECYAGEIKKNKNPFKSMPIKGDRTDESLKLYGYTDSYVAAGYGTENKPEIYEPFWFRTFRYIQVTVQTAVCQGSCQ